MDPVIQAKLAAELRKVRLSYGAALIIFLSSFVGLFLFLLPIAGGWAYLVWIVLGIMLLFGWLQAYSVTALLTQKGEYVKVENIKGKYASSITTAYSTVAEKAGFESKDFTPYVAKRDDPNAFATGTGSSRSVVVHKGLIDLLTQREVEGVIAHEFGHLKHNDIFILIFVTSVIMSWIIIGRFLIEVGLRTRSSSKKSKDSNIWIALAGLVCLAIGYIFAPLASAFLSRRREDLADSFAAGLGYGKDLASALAKLEKYAATTKPEAEGMAALYINAAETTANGILTSKRESLLVRIVKFIAALFATHPPTKDRIARLNRLASGDQGVVPDKLENAFWGTLSWIVLPALGAVALAWSGNELPGMFGIPFVYVANIAWLFCLNLSLTAGSTTLTKKERANPALMIFGLLIIFFVWGLGLYVTHASHGIVALSAVASIAFWVGVTKPVAGMIGTWSGMAGVVSDVCTFLSILYSLVILAALFVPIIVRMF